MVICNRFPEKDVDKNQSRAVFASPCLPRTWDVTSALSRKAKNGEFV